jgi:hypothetical protein
VASFADEGVRAGGQGVNGKAAGEFEDPGFDVFAGIDQANAQVIGDEIEAFGPALAVVQVEEGGVFIAR